MKLLLSQNNFPKNSLRSKLHPSVVFARAHMTYFEKQSDFTDQFRYILK